MTSHMTSVAMVQRVLPLLVISLNRLEQKSPVMLMLFGTTLTIFFLPSTWTALLVWT